MQKADQSGAPGRTESIYKQRERLRREIEERLERVQERDDEKSKDAVSRLKDSAKLLSDLDDEIGDIMKNQLVIAKAMNRFRPSYQAITIEIPKWRTTILLGLNSAAILAAMARPNLPREAARYAILLFLAGILLALMAGIMMERMGSLGLQVADDIEAIDLDKDLEPRTALDSASKSVGSLSRIILAAEGFRWLSIAAFAAGVILCALSI